MAPKRLFEMVTASPYMGSTKKSNSGTSSTTVGNATKSSSGYKRGKYNKSSNKLANFVKAVIRGDAEKKEVLTSVSVTLNATQTSVQLINGCAQGTTGITRVGLEITHGYIEVSLGIINSVLATNLTGPYNGDWGFWALVLDRQPNGALPSFGAIFDDSVGGQPGNDFRITTTNQDRFKILKREEWSVGCGSATPTSSTTLSVTGAPPYHCKEYLDLSKLKGPDAKVNFSGSGSSIASIDSGSVYFVIAGCTSDADNTTPVVGQVKYRFSDV